MGMDDSLDGDAGRDNLGGLASSKNMLTCSFLALCCLLQNAFDLLCSRPQQVFIAQDLGSPGSLLRMIVPLVTTTRNFGVRNGIWDTLYELLSK